MPLEVGNRVAYLFVVVVVVVAVVVVVVVVVVVAVVVTDIVGVVVVSCDCHAFLSWPPHPTTSTQMD